MFCLLAAYLVASLSSLCVSFSWRDHPSDSASLIGWLSLSLPSVRRLDQFSWIWKHLPDKEAVAMTWSLCECAYLIEAYPESGHQDEKVRNLFKRRGRELQSFNNLLHIWSMSLTGELMSPAELKNWIIAYADDYWVALKLGVVWTSSNSSTRCTWNTVNITSVAHIHSIVLCWLMKNLCGVITFALWHLFGNYKRVLHCIRCFVCTVQKS